ncbi:hypothetical protein [Sphingobacterium prati]|uniref:hypothetical protein n=1 Tax=Sphingobacterium prati TaxID=2737006 RepID=UPI00155533EF|nr:hypothetical protein [Sphingobacterium prati]NPE46466.1 hypothetical protein [Sphingobacterium prati]
MEINSQLIIDRLSERMDLDRVYLVKYQFLNQEYYHLLLALKPVSGLSHKVLKPIVELCLMGQENVSFELVPIGEMLNKIKTGSLYYSYASLPAYNIHLASKKKNPPLSAKELKSILELSAEYYQKMLPVSKSFIEGAEMFAEQGNYQRAVFMLHQSVENHLRFLQIMIDGKANNVPHINNRIKSLNEHFSILRESIIGKNADEKERFKLLDSAFDAVKQNKDIEISVCDASWLYDHCSFILDLVEQLYLSFIKGLQTGYEKSLEAEAQKVREDKTATSGNCAEGGKNVVQQGQPIFHAFPWPEQYQSDIYHLLNQLRQENHPEQIMLLNYYTSNASGKGLFDYPRKESGAAAIYLAVIKKKIGSSYFRKVSYGQVTAVVAFLNTSFVETKLNKGSRFSQTIWNESVVLYRNPAYKPTYFICPINWSDTLVKTKNTWTRNLKLIQDLVEIMSGEHSSNRQLAALLLNQLVSIGLHSYLYLRIGYAPPSATIEDLIEWTCICDKKVKAFFEPHGALEEILNSEILKVMKGRVYELPSELDRLDIAHFKSRAKEIADFFIDLCEQSLAYMEMKSGVAEHQN